MLELIRDQPVGPPEEGFGCAVELFAEPIGGFLADRAHAVLELERACLAPSVDLARGRPLELVDLATLELCEGDLDPRLSFALRAIDLLGNGVLVLAETLRQVVDRPSPVVGLGLELVERLGERVSCGRLERLAEPNGGGALLVDGRSELVRLGLDLRLDLGNPLALTLLERGDRSLEPVLRALEVGLPGAQALLDAPFDGRDQLRHPLGQLPLADAELATPLIREASLLCDIRRERVCMGAGDGDAKLLRLRRRLGLGGRTDRAARICDELVGTSGSRSRPSEREDEPDAQDESCAEGAEEDPSDERHATMLDH